jgi:hypothetical protein
MYITNSQYIITILSPYMVNNQFCRLGHNANPLFQIRRSNIPLSVLCLVCVWN